ncbi:hypothetical protein Tco_0723310, partial [Tanacetum coccineum]
RNDPSGIQPRHGRFLVDVTDKHGYVGNSKSFVQYDLCLFYLWDPSGGVLASVSVGLGCVGAMMSRDKGNAYNDLAVLENKFHVVIFSSQLCFFIGHRLSPGQFKSNLSSICTDVIFRFWSEGMIGGGKVQAWLILLEAV